MKPIKQHMAEACEGMSEKDIQGAILELLWRMSLPAFPVPNHGLYNPRTNRYNVVNKSQHVKGVPDIVCPCPHGRTVYFEVKNFHGRTSDEQMQYHSLLQKDGHLVAVVKSPREVLDCLKAWRIIKEA